jgi:hypothetical protein|tara:strand:+ start:326 stop:700 length:375 start_codon:yes stop_codon:yes gene_type:complete
MKKLLSILLVFPLLFISSCEEDIESCTDEEVCNFNINATSSDVASCEYPAQGFDCEGIVTAQIGAALGVGISGDISYAPTNFVTGFINFSGQLSIGIEGSPVTLLNIHGVYRYTSRVFTIWKFK